MTTTASVARPTVVPYVTAWTGELDLAMTKPLAIRIAQTPIFTQVGYADETPADRDVNGVLWQRIPELAVGDPRRGEPRYAKVHAPRQRRCMEGLLCQVCGGPATTDAFNRMLWVIPAKEYQGYAERGWLRTGNPPVCKGCVPVALAQCPHLAKGMELAWVSEMSCWGYYGIDALDPDMDARYRTVALNAPELETVLAGQMLLGLRGVQLTSREALGLAS